MNKYNFFSRYFFSMAMTLTFCQSPLLSAETASPLVEVSKQSTLVGSLHKGLNFTLIPSSNSKGVIWIKFSCSFPNHENNQSISLLTQHALFYGTEKYNREEITRLFNQLGLDIDPDSYLQSNDAETSLQFSLSDSKPETMKTLLEIVNQLVFYPTLHQEGIHLARTHLLSNLDKSETESLKLKNIQVSALRKFHSDSYQPKNMHLTIVGYNNNEEMLTILSNAFQDELKATQKVPSVQELSSIPQKTDEENPLLNPLIDRVDWAPDNQCLIVDGKIWMKDPNWINKSKNGKTLGVFLTILGIGGMILAFPIAAPIAVIAGSLSTITGIYFCASDYLKDPYYVESLRQIDQQKGCAYAYKHSRAGITLTPYERRASFLQEMVDHPETLSKYPILLLADFYQLNDPVIAEIFTVDEFNILTKLKRDFVLQRNEYKMMKELLEKELIAFTSPHAATRDLALQHAEDVYYQNYFVISKNALKENYNENVDKIEESFKKGEIGLDEKNDLITQAKNNYEACISAPDFKAGLASAETALVEMQHEIETNYAYQVEICKQTIQYNQRMDVFQKGESYLVNYFNNELRNLLSSFPVYLTLCPDFVDLRGL